MAKQALWVLIAVAAVLVSAAPLSKKEKDCIEPETTHLAAAPPDDEDSDDAAIDQIRKSRSLDVTPPHLKDEPVAPRIHTNSPDGRDSMEPPKNATVEPDCDSPQIGEVEPWPLKATDVDMNGKHVNHSRILRMKEQREAREVLLGAESILVNDDPSAFSGPELDHPSEFKRPEEFSPSLRMEKLPEPDEKVAAKSKCSRTNNGNDIPDALHALDDDCGMPEPEIPCETAGNSTLCVTRIQLPLPPIPKVEVMPPIPPQPYVLVVPQFANVSVEFVDFGVSRDVMSHVSNTVGRVIEEAGDQFGVDSWAVQLVRSGGADVTVETLVHDLPDRSQLIVYLKCAYARFHSKLIARIPTCEDLLSVRYQVQIEVPAFHAVYTVSVLSSETVGAAIVRAPLNLQHIDQVTYDGHNVSLDTQLERIPFRNNSALVVYPEEPCPSRSTTPSSSPTPLPSPSTTPSVSNCPDCGLPKKHKARKLGAYDAYRHCSNARGGKVQLPDPAALGLDPAAVDPSGKAANPDAECEGSEMTVEEEPDRSNLGAAPKELPNQPANNTLGRQPMTGPVAITVKYEDRTFPVLIKPVSHGIDIFDAVQRVSGQDHNSMVAIFMDRVIDHYTALKPFGFIEGDVVEVKNMEKPAAKRS